MFLRNAEAPRGNVHGVIASRIQQRPWKYRLFNPCGMLAWVGEAFFSGPSLRTKTEDSLQFLSRVPAMACLVSQAVDLRIC